MQVLNLSLKIAFVSYYPDNKIVIHVYDNDFGIAPTKSTKYRRFYKLVLSNVLGKVNSHAIQRDGEFG